MNGLDLGVEGGWKEEHGIRPILRRAPLQLFPSNEPLNSYHQLANRSNEPSHVNGQDNNKR
jgi:hypothetical protein